MSASSEVDKAREYLAKADWARKVARACDSAQTKMRLGKDPVIRRGILRWLPTSEGAQTFEVTSAESEAIYHALSVVRQQQEGFARDYEAKVRTEATR